VGEIEVAIGRLEKLLRSKEVAGREKDRAFLRLPRRLRVVVRLTDRQVGQRRPPNAAMSEAPLRRRVPIEPGFFTIPQDPAEPPRLLGSRCRACGEHFFPRRQVCARCLAQGCDDVLLGPRGTLYTFTWVHVPFFGKKAVDGAGYGVGQVDLREGPRIQAVLSGARNDLAIGMPMTLELETLRETPDGEAVVIHRFRPGA
jgi:uncharacterized OB-fold protein